MKAKLKKCIATTIILFLSLDFFILKSEIHARESNYNKSKKSKNAHLNLETRTNYPKQTKTNKNTKTLTLYGQIDEMSYLCSSTGVKLTSNTLPAQIDKISLGSAAAYSGLHEGDILLKLELKEDSILFTIKRKNKVYQTLIATNVSGLKKEFETCKVKFSFGHSAFDKEILELNNYHVVILLDRSLSMSETHSGCPGNISKWLWCKEQIDNVFIATDRLLEQGFDLTLFNNSINTYKEVTLWDIKEIFARTNPSGTGRDLSKPIINSIEDFLYKQKTGKLKNKTCLIILLTDAKENLGESMQDTLIKASIQTAKEKNIIVSLLQVGESIRAEEFFDDLDNNLMAKGASYHIAFFKPFAELRNRGLLWEILAIIKQAKQTQTEFQQKH